ncbi:K+ transporter [Swaminathania salitolerans LMG 21291]|uniref:Probable potassium transport system protein Kup n=2 Tax=Swaminathania salitolerans TaxID=182838 RepID=A0A511BSF5_9PROT|nr:K+ transporter [Swaminathania salitolerans LMG 21291]GEL03215.1 putative potassium transport system protein kup 3 [Swaminathania salitolerans]
MLPGALAALGIVFGDIGTSPLYTLQTVLTDTGTSDRATLLGSFSLLVWTMILVVAVKYAMVVMRADNKGEGGILALFSLVGGVFGKHWYSRGTLLSAAGLFGAALLYGDGAITPAISVLSAVEGIGVVTHSLDDYILPIATIILLGIFMVQPLGTARISRVFGPVMLLWFLCMGGLGAASLLGHPGVLVGLDPVFALRFLYEHGGRSLVILGAVFLSVTGAEALYADMSHVGRPSVRLALGLVVLPMLILSYAGQTAFLMSHPGVRDNPFFAAMPHALVLPMVILATFATIIASQAIITGAFTLTRQAIQLGWFPSLNIRQTSDAEYGQIYVSVVNWLLMVVTLLIALTFRSSDALSGAYGTAVSTTMLMTTLLIFDVMRARWAWPLWKALPVALFFGAIDLAFFVANLMKIGKGGYVPLLIGLFLYIVMTTWRRGTILLRAGLAPLGEGSEKLRQRLRDKTLTRTPGEAVFLSRYESALPPIVMRHAADFNCLPERVVALNVRFETVPRVAPEHRMTVKETGDGLWQINVRFGFVEVPNLYYVLSEAREKGCSVDLDKVVFVSGNDDVVKDLKRPKMFGPRRILFGFLYRNAVRASDRFTLPRERLIEVGHQVEI